MEEEKKMPADPKRNVSDNEINTFSTFGQIGWEYFSGNLLNCKDDDKLKEYINFLSRTKEIKLGLKELYPENFQVKFELLNQRKDFRYRILNDYVLFKKEVLGEEESIGKSIKSRMSAMVKKKGLSALLGGIKKRTPNRSGDISRSPPRSNNNNSPNQLNIFGG